MAHNVPKKTLTTLIAGLTKHTDITASTTVSKHKPKESSVGALVGSSLVVARAPSGLSPKAPTVAVEEGVEENKTVKANDDKKKDGMVKQMSGLLVPKSTADKPVSNSVDAIVAGISQLAIYGDKGEMSRRHQHQLSTLSVKCESTESGNKHDNDNNVEQDSPILGGLDSIDLIGPTRGGRGQAKLPRKSTTDKPAQSNQKQRRPKEERGSAETRITTYHSSEPCPDAEDLMSFKQQLNELPTHLQTIVLSYGGNTHQKMLQVMSHIRLHRTKPTPLVDIVYNDAQHYKSGKLRQKPGIRHVTCGICGHKSRTIGRIAAHLTEAHWKLKPWRCWTCDECFSHPDSRRAEHISNCRSRDMPETINQVAGSSRVFHGTNSGPSVQTPPDSTLDPTYQGNTMFAPYQTSGHALPAPRANSAFNHNPTSGYSEQYGDYYDPSSSPTAHQQGSSSPNTSVPRSSPNAYTQQPPLSLNSNWSASPHSVENLSVPLAASPSSYGGSSPVGLSPTDARPHQRYSSTYNIPLPTTSDLASRQRHEPAWYTHGETLGSNGGLTQYYEPTTMARPSAPHPNVSSRHVGNTFLPSQGYTANEEQYLPTTDAQQRSRTNYTLGSEHPRDQSTGQMYPQLPPNYPGPNSTSSTYYANQSTVQAEYLPPPDLEPLWDISNTLFWPGESMV